MLDWIPPAAAAGTALIFLVVVARWSPTEGAARFPSKRWFESDIHVDASWDIADSWLTNTSFFGNAASGIVVAAGGLTNVVASTDQAITATTLVLFSAAALGAPIVFAALSAAPSAGAVPTAKVTGTNGGLFAAAAVTLFAAFGGLAMAGLVTWGATASGAEKGIVIAGLALAAIPIAIYASRSLNEIATFHPQRPAGEGAGGALSSQSGSLTHSTSGSASEQDGRTNGETDAAGPPVLTDGAVLPRSSAPATGASRARSLLQGTGKLSGTL